MKIQILMSTYNGARYLRTQLDSIIRQTIKEKRLLIRDDGSTDNTMEILHEYQEKYSWIKVYRGNNLGVQKSFFELIEKSDPMADYIAFADQDDDWLPEKLEHAVNKLKELSLINSKKPIPLLYCGGQIMVDEQLQPLDVTVSRVVRIPAFGNALVQNICTGCTAVINQNLAQLIRENIPVNTDAIVMHDWWLYLTASCFGEVFYDDVPYIRYRQHGKNAHGAILNKRTLFRYRLEQLTKPRGEIYKQVESFEITYRNKIKADQNKLIRDLINSKNNLLCRFLVATQKKYFRQKRSDDLVFRGIVLLGKL
ncbi:MAG: glycosyltransferase family 2 protein [Lachnospiraceae bacterium]|nr:glycosyltransferase family 2 protein [Lachnospiraceae bacterium]